MNTIHGRLREAEQDCSNLNRQFNDANKEIESLKQKLAESQTTNRKLRDALEFYADQNHVECLSRKRDWIADRKALADRGFRFEGESANGDETYIEYGLTAEQALALPNDATALNELIAERTADKEIEVKHLLGKLTLADNAIAELTAQRDAAIDAIEMIQGEWVGYGLPKDSIGYVRCEEALDAAIANCNNKEK